MSSVYEALVKDARATEGIKGWCRNGDKSYGLHPSSSAEHGVAWYDYGLGFSLIIRPDMTVERQLLFGGARPIEMEVVFRPDIKKVFFIKEEDATGRMQRCKTIHWLEPIFQAVLGDDWKVGKKCELPRLLRRDKRRMVEQISTLSPILPNTAIVAIAMALKA